MKLKFIILLFCLGIGLAYSQNLGLDFEKLNVRMLNGEEVSNSEFEKLLKVYSKQLQNYPDESAKVYYYLGGSFYRANKVDEATQNFSSAYNYSLKAKDTTLKYIIILSFARISNNMKNYEKADEYYRYALPGMSAIYGQSSLEYTKIYFEYIRLIVNMGRLTEAKPMLDALEYYFKTLNMNDDPTYLAVIGNQAYIMQEEGKYKEAIEKYEFILENDKLLKKGDTLEHVIIISNLGETYREMGDHDMALTYLQKAKRLLKTYKLNNATQSASIENNLGLVYKSLGDYRNSEENFDYAIRIYKEAQLDKSEEYCSTLSNKADLMRLLGRRQEGLNLLETALRIRKSYFGANFENYANALSNYALITYEEGNYKIAQAKFEEALIIYEGTISKKHQSYANCLNNLASCYYQNGEFKKAEDYKFAAIHIIEETLGKNHFKYISFILGSTEILLATKNYEKARQMLNESKELASKKYGKDNDLYTRSLVNLAWVNLVTGKFEESLTCYEEAIEHKMNSLSSFFYSMNRENQVLYLEEIQGEMFMYNTALFDFREVFPKKDINTHFEKYFNFQLVLKSLLNKNVTEWQRQIAESKDEELKSNFLKWSNTKNELNDLYKSDYTYEEEEVLKTKVNSLESYLKKMVTIQSAASLNFKSVKNLLKPNEAIVDISSYRSDFIDTNFRTKYAALIIRNNSVFPECIILNDNNFKEEDRIKYYNEQMEKELIDSVSYNVFYKNIFASLKGVNKIYVSTQGVYNKVNVQSLYNPHSKKYVLEEMDVVYLPNLNAIATLSLQGNAELTADLFGNPDFNYDFRKETSNKVLPQKELIAKRFGLTELSDLPGTENELKEISNLLSTKKWQIKSYTRSEANEVNIRKVRSPKLLHIATHGYFLNEIETSDRKFLGYNTKAFKEMGDMRSGLILAGASISTGDSIKISAEQDGILTSREASLLNLSNTDLVVLSACQTGLTSENTKTGIVGLQQAFSNAGAKNLIVSLWPVDDRATELLMIKFYEFWLQNSSNQSIDEAFKKAQLAVKEKYKHPYYWGAFILLKN